MCVCVCVCVHYNDLSVGGDSMKSEDGEQAQLKQSHVELIVQTSFPWQQLQSREEPTWPTLKTVLTEPCSSKTLDDSTNIKNSESGKEWQMTEDSIRQAERQRGQVRQVATDSHTDEKHKNVTF